MTAHKLTHYSTHELAGSTSCRVLHMGASVSFTNFGIYPCANSAQAVLHD